MQLFYSSRSLCVVADPEMERVLETMQTIVLGKCAQQAHTPQATEVLKKSNQKHREFCETIQVWYHQYAYTVITSGSMQIIVVGPICKARRLYME